MNYTDKKYICNFDKAATTEVDDEIIQIIEATIPFFSNPSALYGAGTNNRNAIIKLKQEIADILHCNSNMQIFMTSGGTEGDNWILKGYTMYMRRLTHKMPHIITSTFEHHAVLNTCKYLEENGLAEVTYVNPDRNGIVSVSEIEKHIKDNTILVSIMMVNNVLGTIQPIKEITKMCHIHKIKMMTDATQAIGNITVDINNMDVDFLVCSGHKFHALKSVGICYIKSIHEIDPLLHGGSQQFKLRAGTENLIDASIMRYCLYKYCDPEAIKEKQETVECIKKYLLKNLCSFTDVGVINSSYGIGTINVQFKNINSDVLVWKLGSHNIFTSVGSACDNGNFEDNYVLKSIKIPSEYIKGNLRLTFDSNITMGQCDKLLHVLSEELKILRGYE